MSQDSDKRELLKLKQGIIEQSDTVPEDGYDVKMPESASEKTKNWFWYHKWILLIGALIIILGAVIASVYFIKPKPDIEIYSVSNYTTTFRRLFETNLPRWCDDVNGDGQSVVTVAQAPDDAALSAIEDYEEMQNGSSFIFIGTKDELKALDTGDIFADISEFENAEDNMLDFTKTAVGKELKIFSNEVYMAIKATGDEREDAARGFLHRIVENKEVVPNAD